MDMLPWFWVCCTSKPLDTPEECECFFGRGVARLVQTVRRRMAWVQDDTDDFLFRGDRPDSQIRSSTPICKHHRVLQAGEFMVVMCSSQAANDMISMVADHAGY